MLWIDYGRAIAILLVILGHSMLAELDGQRIPALEAAYSVMTPFRMPVLAFLRLDRAPRDTEPLGAFTWASCAR